MMDASLIKAWADPGITEQGLGKLNYVTAQIPKYSC